MPEPVTRYDMPPVVIGSGGRFFLLVLFVGIAFGCLTYTFIANDFSVLYVATHSNSRLPLGYRVAGVWGGHEGSLLLWMLMLALWMGFRLARGVTGPLRALAQGTGDVARGNLDVEVQVDTEWLVTAKTVEGRVPALAARVQELHPYEVPEVVAVPTVGGSEAYLDWVRAEST